MAEHETSTEATEDATVVDPAPGEARGPPLTRAAGVSPRALAVALGGGNDPRRAALLAGRGNRYVQAVARELAAIGPARPRLARTPVTPPPTGEPVPRTDPLAGTPVHEVVVSLVRRRVGFFTPLGTILGKVDTDLKPGTYTLRAEPDSKRWVVEGGTDARFAVTLEGADPWTLRYDGPVALRVLEGQRKEPATWGEALGESGPRDPLWLYEGLPLTPGPVKGIDDFDSFTYDPSYRHDQGALSKWLRLSYRDGTTTELHLDEIDASTPNLWAAKQEVAVIMDDYNATYILESVFPSVFTILTLTPQPTGGARRRPVFTRREFDREVVVEIGAGDLRASVRAAVERDAKVIAVDPEPPPAAAVAELESAGGTYLQGTAEQVPAASADHVFQFFPHRSWGTGGTWHGGTWRLMEDTARILRPGGSGRFVTEDRETAQYLVEAAKREGLVPTLAESTAGVAAPGASGAGVPKFSGETKVWVVEVTKP